MLGSTLVVVGQKGDDRSVGGANSAEITCLWYNVGMEPVNADAKRRPNGTFGAGNSANDLGRPKGTSLKEYQAQRFREMTDEEKDEYLSDIAKVERWRMGEGNPATNTDITSGGEKLLIMPAQIIEKNATD